MSTEEPQQSANDVPRHRYDARLANEIEARWQDRWDREHTFWAPNPAGLLSEGADRAHAATLVDFCHMLINANEFVYAN